MANSGDKTLSDRILILEMDMERALKDFDLANTERKDSHLLLNQKLDKIGDRTARIERYAYMGIGGLMVMEFVLKAFGK